MQRVFFLFSRNKNYGFFCFQSFAFNKTGEKTRHIQYVLLEIIHFVVIYGLLSANLLPKPFSYDKIIQY